MVTAGLPTARTQREDTAQLKGWDGNYTTSHANKTNQHTTTTRERPRKNRVDTTNPPPMILDHLAFSPNFPQFPPSYQQEPLRPWEDLPRCFQMIFYREHQSARGPFSYLLQIYPILVAKSAASMTTKFEGSG